MPFTNYAAQRITNWLTGNTPATPPTTLYLAALTAITDALAGTVTEATGGSSARIVVAFDVSATNGRAPSAAQYAFPNEATAAITRTIVGLALYDALTGGNCWFVQALAGGDQFTWNTGQSPTVDAGALGLDSNG
jgi:hypothetical protein